MLPSCVPSFARFDPDDAHAQLSLAEYATKRGDAKTARERFGEVLRVYGSQRNFDPKLASNFARNVAMRLDQLGDHVAAEQAMQRPRQFEEQSQK